jgi:3-oxoacyl-[acyl-carrier protein] reductase
MSTAAGPFRLDGGVALVTGASRGIGQACLLALAGAGARVVGTATSEQGVASIEAALAAAGVPGRGVVLDVTSPERTTAVIAEIEAHEGAVSVLVNNAGITRDGLLLRMKEEDWRLVLDTNLASAFRLSKAVLRGMMKARYGRIICIGSVVGETGNAGQTSYASAKSGLVGFAKSLASEVASRNITVNVVAPGFIDTDMTRGIPDAARTQLLAQIPLARLGSPQDVAWAVLYLASPAAAYVTGTTLAINGGMHMA